jgi:hypothetical protein
MITFTRVRGQGSKSLRVFDPGNISGAIPPGKQIRWVQSRISDSRVAQFWDRDHLVAKQLRQQFPSSQALCCKRNGILWDVAALYPSGVQWGNAAPVYFGGAVVDVAPEVSQNLSALR